MNKRIRKKREKHKAAQLQAWEILVMEKRRKLITRPMLGLRLLHDAAHQWYDAPTFSGLDEP